MMLCVYNKGTPMTYSQFHNYIYMLQLIKSVTSAEQSDIYYATLGTVFPYMHILNDIGVMTVHIYNDIYLSAKYAIPHGAHK